MENSGTIFWSVALMILTFLEGPSATLSPSGVNYEGLFIFSEFSFKKISLVYLNLVQITPMVP